MATNVKVGDVVLYTLQVEDENQNLVDKEVPAIVRDVITDGDCVNIAAITNDGITNFDQIGHDANDESTLWYWRFRA